MSRLLATLLLAAALAALAVPAAHARTWTGKVIAVDDGDTMDVRVDGRVRQVRFIAVQAMELTRYSTHPEKRRGQCHGLEATARLEQIIRRGGNRVRLTASRANLVDHKGRLRRSVAVRIGGRWRDVGSMLIKEGHALWLPALDERAVQQDLQPPAAGGGAERPQPLGPRPLRQRPEPGRAAEACGSRPTRSATTRRTSTAST